MCSSPRLLAAYHGLLRTVAPRHPPWTLSRLTIFSLNACPVHHCTVSRVVAPWVQRSGTPPTVARVSSFRCQWTDSTLSSSILPSSCQRPCVAVARDYYSRLSQRPSNAPSMVSFTRHWRYGDLNPRPMACKATALATELYPQARFPARERTLLAQDIYRKGRRV